MAIFTLVKTSSGCPEQYDIFKDGGQVGYARLRHGYFRVENNNGDMVYESHPQGNGAFADDAERDLHLTAGLNKLLLDLEEEEQLKLYEITNDV